MEVDTKFYSLTKADFWCPLVIHIILFILNDPFSNSKLLYNWIATSLNVSDVKIAM